MPVNIGFFLENINPNSYTDMVAVLHNIDTLIDTMPCNRLKLCFLAFREELIRQIRELRFRQQL